MVKEVKHWDKLRNEEKDYTNFVRKMKGSSQKLGINVLKDAYTPRTPHTMVEVFKKSNRLYT